MVLKMTSPFAWLGVWKTLLSYSTRSPRNGLTTRPGTHSRRSRAETEKGGTRVTSRHATKAAPRPFTLALPALSGVVSARGPLRDVRREVLVSQALSRFVSGRQRRSGCTGKPAHTFTSPR